MLAAALAFQSTAYGIPGRQPTTTPAAMPVVLKIVTATGEAYQGEFHSYKLNRLELRSLNRQIVLHVPNIVSIEVVGKEPDPKADPAKRLRETAKVLHELHQGDLAELCFSMATELASGPTAGPSVRASAAVSMEPRRPASCRRYPLCTREQIEASRQCTEQWATRAKEIAPAIHLIQTPNFQIYSAWPGSDDDALREIYGKLYQSLCRQFDIDPREQVWAGRLPVFAFWEKEQFAKFSIDIVDVPPHVANHAGGYAGTRATSQGLFHYVVLGPVQQPGMSKAEAKIWFFELLVHESCHAFMSRFIREITIPNWVEEGLAETMAGTLVPGSRAADNFKNASKFAVRENMSVNNIFDVKNIPLNPYAYGVAQSLVRYLIHVDRQKFIQFVKVLKEGKTDQEALHAVYGWTREQMVTSWRQAIGHP